MNETYDKSYNLDRSLEDDLNNRDNLLTSIFSSDCPDKQFNGLSFSTLHEFLKKAIFLGLTKKHQFQKMVNHTQTIRRQFPDELFECVLPFCGIGAQTLNIGHININSVRNRFELLRERIKDNKDILLVSKTN